MDKTDILGIERDNKKTDICSSKKHSEYMKLLENKKEATDFATFVRSQTKKNLHLNFYSKKIFSESDKIDLSKLKMFRFDKLSKEEIVSILKKCVIKVTDTFIVLNKPNGIAVQDGRSQCISIIEILDYFSKFLNFKETLHVVHRLDKDTTGTLILARNPETAFLFKEAFLKGQIRKNYLCLTHGIPHPNEGIIDFPFKEKTTDANTIIGPDMKFINKVKKSDSKVCTAYKILSSNHNIAFIQCAMVSGVKHQIRAHLAYGLETPIIGDHKYSWLIKSNKFPIPPQNLSAPALNGLMLEAKKVRYLPIHLHAHQIIIGEPPLPPSSFDGKANLGPATSSGITNTCRLPNCQIYANLPPFFVKHLKLLDLYDFRFLKTVLKNIL